MRDLQVMDEHGEFYVKFVLDFHLKVRWYFVGRERLFCFAPMTHLLFVRASFELTGQETLSLRTVRILSRWGRGIVSSLQ